ncbi:hypothetical protein SCLCIDRAFT_275599 [Scleroderma citrinum Foug A]|uniref:Uncharacterized protein n=1 Tax=Scleroderma citrinum Foug A TaxID=1036808 RepID=A0A0C3D529_9AGAM|nr:hypothetical protein SCLCIDRAFT_275599 [Scleroderma citrinum Foug A]
MCLRSIKRKTYQRTPRKSQELQTRNDQRNFQAVFQESAPINHCRIVLTLLPPHPTKTAFKRIAGTGHYGGGDRHLRPSIIPNH